MASIRIRTDSGKGSRGKERRGSFAGCGMTHDDISGKSCSIWLKLEDGSSAWITLDVKEAASIVRSFRHYLEDHESKRERGAWGQPIEPCSLCEGRHE